MDSIPTSKPTLRVAIVTENFLPKSVSLPLARSNTLITASRIDGVTRTLARLLEHLQAEGHIALVLGPNSGMASGAVCNEN